VTLSGALIVLAMLLLVGGPVLGLVFFSSDRARSVKVAEENEPAVAEQLNQVVVYHPEIIRRHRLDRHQSYVWVHVGLWMYGAGVLLSPAPNTNLAALSWSTQQALGLCLWVGSTLALIGVTLGARLGRWRIAGRVSRNIMSPMLGDDIRLPYTLACTGLLSILVAMGFYVWTLVASSPSKLLGTLGGGLSAAIGLMCVTLAVELIARIRAYTHAREKLLAEAFTRMGREP
jgi:hypothetical protein